MKEASKTHSAALNKALEENERKLREAQKATDEKHAKHQEELKRLKKEQEKYLQEKHKKNEALIEKLKHDQVLQVEKAKKQHAITMKFLSKMEQKGKERTNMAKRLGGKWRNISANEKKSIKSKKKRWLR